MTIFSRTVAGMASGLGKWRQATCTKKSEKTSKQCTQCYMKESIWGGVVPVIGKCSAADQIVSDANVLHRLCEDVMQQHVEVVEADSEITSCTDNPLMRALLDEKASQSTEPPDDLADLGDDSDDTEAADSESEDGEIIPGILDIPPPSGTLVKVLHENDEWRAAEILRVYNTKAKVRFEDGKCLVLDFEEIYAVRLAEYEGDDHYDSGSGMSPGEESEEECHDNCSVEACDSSDSSDSEEDCEDEGSLGSLLVAPPVGTLVEILCEGDDGDVWFPARVIWSSCTIARVVTLDGECGEHEIDFEENVVRLHRFSPTGEDCIVRRHSHIL